MYIVKIEYFRMHFFRMRAYFGGHSKKKTNSTIYRSIQNYRYNEENAGFAVTQQLQSLY
jgi:hypothetical protein